MGHALLLHELTWMEAREYFRKNDVALLPVGSTEQHGPQNPLGTDHLIAYALAVEASRRTGVLCLPVIPFGVSAHHRHFEGSIYISPKAFRAYVKDVLLSLASYGVKKVVIVNGHGGNLASLLEVARELRRRRVLFAVVFQWWDAVRGLFPKGEEGHAAALETSLNLYLHESLVKIDRARDEFTEHPISKIKGAHMPWDTRDYTRSGVMGIATTANKDKGKKVWEIAVDALCSLIEELKRHPLEELLH